MKRRWKTGGLFDLAKTFFAMLIAILVTVIIVFLVSKEPLESLESFFVGPFTSVRRFGNMIEAAMPIIFCALAVCVMFQANQFSMIAEGSFFLGALIASIIAIKVALPAGLHPAVCILAGGVAGGMLGSIPGYCKAKWGSNEFVISFMLNYVMLHFCLLLLDSFILDPDAGARLSLKFQETAMLTVLFPGTRISTGILLCTFAVVATYLFLYRTNGGYALRITGMNRRFADYAGMNTFSTILCSQLIGGAIAGIGGATEVIGLYDRFQWSALPGYGFDGIAVAIIAKKNPKYVPIAALFLAYIRTGADIMSRMNDVPSQIISVIQALAIILVAANGFLSGWSHRQVVKTSMADKRG